MHTINVKRSTSERSLTFPLMLLAISVCLSLLTGCGNVIRRGQSPDNSFNSLASNSSTETKFIEDYCGVKGLRPGRIEGIGLVIGLEGTGSEPAPSGQKDYLLRELRTDKTTENIKSAVASENTSMVLIRGLIPAAANKGDRIDIEVITPPKSDTTSLKYGQLLQTDLRPMAFLSRSVKLGNTMGKARGHVLVDGLFEGSNEDGHLLRGRILGGGIVAEDRPLTLVVRTDDTSVKVSRSIAHSINQRFSSYSSNGRENTANPVTDRVIELNIPNEYQHNLGRFIQALMAMSFDESVDDRIERIDSLDRRIVDPATSQRASIELEAIGEEGLPALQRAVTHPDFEVRFHAAEALAYLGQTEGIPHLKLAAESEPAFRWHALTALASMDSKQASQALFDLFDVQSAETRYGAFRALQACRPDDHRIVGKLLADEYYFHVIPSKGPGLVHFARTKRPEIVIFGTTDRVTDDFLFVEPGLTAKAVGADRVQITRFDPLEGEIQMYCSSNIADLIKTLARFGIDYTTMLEMCQEANASGSLNSRLVIDAVPSIGSKSLEESDAQPRSTQSEKYIASPMPDLFSDIQPEETGASAVAEQSP